jgi:hypothetical protein
VHTNGVEASGGKVTNLMFSARARAMLRRTDPFEVKESYVWARQVSKQLGLSENQAEQTRLVKFSPVAALIREDSPLSLGKALKRANIGERHVRRLLASDRSDVDEQLARMVRLLGRKANVVDLTATSIFWGEKRIRAIAMDYFGVDEDATEQEPTE